MKKNLCKKVGLVILIVAAAAIISVSSVAMVKGSGKADTLQKTEFFGMNTYITFSAYGKDAEKALKKAEDKMAELEEKWSVTDKNSEIYRLNQNRGESLSLSNETAEIIAYVLHMAAKTEGALEPTIYPVLTAWGFTGDENRVPEKEELEALLSRVGYEKVKLNENQIQLPQGMELDLGAVGKGYAGDIVTGILKEEGISSAILDIGGNIQTIGCRPDGSDWRLGIRNPFGEGNLGVLSVSDRTVITSGNYERYFTDEDGREYGHIIDPDTGYPADNELTSVTVITEEGKQGDALSTALFVKGLQGAIDYWRKYADFEMIAVTKQGEIYLTEGIRDAFTLSDSFSNMQVKEITGQ